MPVIKTILLNELPIYGSCRRGNYIIPVSLAGSSTIPLLPGEVRITSNTVKEQYENLSYLVDPGVQLTLAGGFTYTSSAATGNTFVVRVGELGSGLPATEHLYTRRLNSRQYELKDHLDNVRSVISDVKLSVITGTTPGSYEPEVTSVMNYYPFGMEQPSRMWSASGKYRYGFNGKEKDDNGEWGSVNYDYGFRIYNPSIGRFLSVDPLTKEYPWYTPYQFAGNSPIKFVDIDGLEPGNPENDINEGAASFVNSITNFGLWLTPGVEAGLRLKMFGQLGITDINIINQYQVRMANVAMGAPHLNIWGTERVQDYERHLVLEPKESAGKELLKNGLNGLVVLSTISGLKGSSPGSTPAVLFASGGKILFAHSVAIRTFFREGDYGGMISLFKGNKFKGFQHILERHSADQFLDVVKGDLFPKGTTVEQIFEGIQEVYSKGNRVSDVEKAVQTFEKRIKLNGESANYRLIVDKKASEVVSFYKIGGTEKQVIK